MNPDSTVDPHAPHGGTNGDSHTGSTGAPTVTPAEYARLTGLHIRTVRERIRRGELPAIQVKGRHGPEYRIPHPDSIPAPTVSVTVDLPSIMRDSHGAPTADPPFLTGDPAAEGLGELVRHIARLEQQNLELAGRCGWLQARLEDAQAQLALRPPSTEDSGAEGPTLRPWWAFWRWLGT